MPRFAGAAASHPGRVLLQNESSRERCEGVAGLRRRHGDGRYSHPRRVLLQKGLASAAVGAPAPGANRGVPGRDEHQLVRGETGCSAPALRLQESGPAAALSSSGRSTTPPPLSRWLLGALALTGWPVFAPAPGAKGLSREGRPARPWRSGV